MEYSKDNLLDENIIQNLIELGGDDGNSFLKEIIDLYIEQFPGLFNDIKSHFEKGDALKMSQSAHALKGASLNIGAKVSASICKEIELKGKGNDLNGISELINELQVVNKLTLSEFNKLL